MIGCFSEEFWKTNYLNTDFKIRKVWWASTLKRNDLKALHRLLFEMNQTKVLSIFPLVKSSKKHLIFLPAFYLIICLMKSPRNFEKIAILKIWQLISFCENYAWFVIEILIHGSKSCVLDILWSQNIIKNHLDTTQTTFSENK